MSFVWLVPPLVGCNRLLVSPLVGVTAVADWLVCLLLQGVCETGDRADGAGSEGDGGSAEQAPFFEGRGGEGGGQDQEQQPRDW